MVAIFLTVVALSGSPGLGACSVIELSRSPGHVYRVDRIRQFIDSAEMIVRAKAVSESGRTPSPNSIYESNIRFEIVERIRAPDTVRVLELRGYAVLHDDFNRDTVPYTMVRSAGQRGDCNALEYRLGAEYLLILGRPYGELTPHWKPLAPFNEQVHGEADSWVLWVRRVASGTGGRDGT